jgi:hypothetical protein
LHPKQKNRKVARNRSIRTWTGISPHEYEFVAPMPPSTGFQLIKAKTLIPEKPENSFWSRHLKWITTDPIFHVVPERHSSIQSKPPRQSANKPTEHKQIRRMK